jgi:GNAT superfamily N-acetyltransferase
VLTELYVEENNRRHGVGRALVAHVEKLAREASARQMLILTDFYNNAAQSLYRAMGYVHYDIALTKDLIDK